MNGEELEKAVIVWFESKEGAIQQFGHISSWDTSLVEDMSHLFDCNDDRRKQNFNEDISSWDVSNVRNMDYLFCKQSSFNQVIPIINYFQSLHDSYFMRTLVLGMSLK